MYACKDSVAFAHARTHAHRPAAPRQSSGVSSQTPHPTACPQTGPSVILWVFGVGARAVGAIPCCCFCFGRCGLGLVPSPPLCAHSWVVASRGAQAISLRTAHSLIIDSSLEYTNYLHNLHLHLHVLYIHIQYYTSVQCILCA